MKHVIIGTAGHVDHGKTLLIKALTGLIGFLGMYLGTIRRAVRCLRHADPMLRHVLIACVSALVGISFLGAAEYILFYPRDLFAFFILLGITLAAAKLAEESK